jgi:excisionase family DNA binding protein
VIPVPSEAVHELAAATTTLAVKGEDLLVECGEEYRPGTIMPQFGDAGVSQGHRVVSANRRWSMDDVKRSNGNQSVGSGDPSASPWLTVTEAARRARCGGRLIYREVQARRLRAARVGGRRELRLRVEWIDEWLEAFTMPQEIVR